MGILALRPFAANVDVDSAISHFDGERVEVVASSGETATASHVIAPPMPVTRQDAVADPSTRQRIPHVRTLVIGRVDVALVLKQRDAVSLHSNRLGSSVRDVLQV